jgi:hypothetical protein
MAECKDCNGWGYEHCWHCRSKQGCSYCDYLGAVPCSRCHGSKIDPRTPAEIEREEEEFRQLLVEEEKRTKELARVEAAAVAAERRERQRKSAENARRKQEAEEAEEAEWQRRINARLCVKCAQPLGLIGRLLGRIQHIRC